MFKKLSERDKVFFAKRMSFLLKAGVPILESLEKEKNYEPKAS